MLFTIEAPKTFPPIQRFHPPEVLLTFLRLYDILYKIKISFNIFYFRSVRPHRKAVFDYFPAKNISQTLFRNMFIYTGDHIESHRNTQNINI